MLIIFNFIFLDKYCFRLYICKEILKKLKVMARPIKETPILYGEDARRFEERMKEKRHEDPEKKAKRLRDYEMIMKIFEG